jgi:hypothetical protein
VYLKIADTYPVELVIFLKRQLLLALSSLQGDTK